MNYFSEFRDIPMLSSEDERTNLECIAPDTSHVRINRVSRNERLPLSFSEESIWLAAQEPGTFHQIPNNLVRATHLKGHLDLRILTDAICEIVRRHEILRTTFPAVEERPIRVISAPEPIKIPLVDLRNKSQNHNADREVQRFCNDKVDSRMDMVTGPLWRIHVLRIDPEEHLLLLALHPIIADCQSISVLYRELCVLYDAYATHSPIRLPELSIQYADYAAWKRQRMQGEIFNKLISYWRKQLMWPDDMPRLISDQSRNVRLISVSFGISKETKTSLQILANTCRATLFMTLLAVFNVFLYLLTGSGEIIVGVPISDRIRSELEDLIGRFMNVIVLRTKIHGERTFRELVAKIRDTSCQAFDHQELPVSVLMQDLGAPLEPKISDGPPIRFTLNFAKPEHKLELGGLQSELFPVSTELRSTADFTLNVSEVNGSLHLVAVYRQIFVSPRIRDVGKEFKALISQVVEDPDRKIDDI